MSNLLPAPEATALLKRYRAIETWCEGRDMTQRESFFSNADPSLSSETDRMAYVRRTKEPRMYDTDEEWIAKCEAIMRALQPAA